MKIDIGKYGKSINGLTEDEVIDLFTKEFGDSAVLAYFEFVQWDLANMDSINPMEDVLLVRRDKVRDFIEGRLAKEAKCLQ